MAKGPGRPSDTELAPFGVRLREAIDESRFKNRAAFLAEIRMQPPVMYRYEKGEKPPRTEDVERWAEILGVTAAWLAYGAGPMRAGESHLDTSEADEEPSTRDEDVAWAASQAGLTDDETRRLGSIRRSKGPMERHELLVDAAQLRRNRGASEPPKEGNAFMDKGRKR